MQGQAYILLCMHINILLALPFQSDNRFGSKDESFSPFVFAFGAATHLVLDNMIAHEGCRRR